MGEGTAFRFVIPEIDAIATPEAVRRVVLCSGKVYYDLLAERREKAISDVAILRLEQLYPIPEKTLARELAPYRNAELVWCQEEPENIGCLELRRSAIGEGAGRAGWRGETAALCRARGGGQPCYRVGSRPCGAAGALVADSAGSRVMATEIKVPTLGESVTSATVARWLKQAGEAVALDEPLVELETDKVTVEVSAPAAGVLDVDQCAGGQRGACWCIAWNAGWRAAAAAGRSGEAGSGAEAARPSTCAAPGRACRRLA